MRSEELLSVTYNMTINYKKNNNQLLNYTKL